MYSLYFLFLPILLGALLAIVDHHFTVKKCKKDREEIKKMYEKPHSMIEEYSKEYDAILIADEISEYLKNVNLNK